MTAVGVLCRLFTGQARTSTTISRGVDILVREQPRWTERSGSGLSTINFYYWYYGSYALFQYGGQLWKKWNDAMLAALLNSQRRGTVASTDEPIDEDGSWDPIGEWGRAGGRVYATALAAMTLEVYYRYERSK